MYGKFKYENLRSNEKSPERKGIKCFKIGIFNYIKSFTQRVGKYLFDEEENTAKYSRNQEMQYPTYHDSSIIYDSPSLSFYPNPNYSTPSGHNKMNVSSNSNIKLSNYNLLGSMQKDDESKSFDNSKLIDNGIISSKKKRSNAVIRIIKYITSVTSRGSEKIHSLAFKKLGEGGNSLISVVNYKKLVEEDENIIRPSPIYLSSFDPKKRKRVREEYSFDKFNPKKSDKKEILSSKTSMSEPKSMTYSKIRSLNFNNSFKAKKDEYEKSVMEFSRKDSISNRYSNDENPKKSDNSNRLFMNIEEIQSKNDYERKKRIIMQYRQSIDRRSQDFDLLRFGKNDSVDTSRNVSRSDMDISTGEKKDLENKESQIILSNSVSEENRKENFKIPDKPKKVEDRLFLNEEKLGGSSKDSNEIKKNFNDDNTKSDLNNNNFSVLLKKPELEKEKIESMFNRKEESVSLFSKSHSNSTNKPIETFNSRNDSLFKTDNIAKNNSNFIKVEESNIHNSNADLFKNAVFSSPQVFEKNDKISIKTEEKGLKDQQTTPHFGEKTVSNLFTSNSNIKKEEKSNLAPVLEINKAINYDDKYNKNSFGEKKEEKNIDSKKSENTILFNNNPDNKPSSNSSSLFGANTTNNNNSSSLFVTTTTNTNNNNSIPCLFGTSSTTTNTNPLLASNSTSNNTNSRSLFATSSSNNNDTNKNSIFGGSSTNNSNSLFVNNSTNSNNNNNNNNSLFSAAQSSNTNSNSLFGASSNSNNTSSNTNSNTLFGASSNKDNSSSLFSGISTDNKKNESINKSSSEILKEDNKHIETGQIFNKLQNSYESKKLDTSEKNFPLDANKSLEFNGNEAKQTNEEKEKKQNNGFLNNYSFEKNETSKSLFFNNKVETSDPKQTENVSSETIKKTEESKINIFGSINSNTTTSPQNSLFSSANNNTSSTNPIPIQGKPNSLFNSSNPFTNCSKPAESMFSSSVQTNPKTDLPNTNNQSTLFENSTINNKASSLFNNNPSQGPSLFNNNTNNNSGILFSGIGSGKTNSIFGNEPIHKDNNSNQLFSISNSSNQASTSMNLFGNSNANNAEENMIISPAMKPQVNNTSVIPMSSSTNLNQPLTNSSLFGNTSSIGITSISNNPFSLQPPISTVNNTNTSIFSNNVPSNNSNNLSGTNNLFSQTQTNLFSNKESVFSSNLGNTIGGKLFTKGK